MANVFGAASTTDEVLSGVNLQGKRILIPRRVDSRLTLLYAAR